MKKNKTLLILLILIFTIPELLWMPISGTIQNLVNERMHTNFEFINPSIFLHFNDVVVKIILIMQLFAIFFAWVLWAKSVPKNKSIKYAGSLIFLFIFLMSFYTVLVQFLFNFSGIG